jgi:hypothetical protein
LKSLQEIQPDFVEEAKAYAGLWSQGKKEITEDSPKPQPLVFWLYEIFSESNLSELTFIQKESQGLFNKALLVPQGSKIPTPSNTNHSQLNITSS